MTLYLLFEQLEAGRVKLDSQMEVSAHAASQAPTKLGVRPGQTLMVEDAIKALVTKSANDASVVIAEHLAGSEDEFARQMTRKARALRMSRTVYKNANGLPDDAQVTTARDQALLGLAIQERFPRYYRYFATKSFVYRGVRMSNHNRLLGSVPGVHGIKTGYIRASGFNLVSAVDRGDRRIVAVVLGGTSAGARDAKMRSLIDQKIVLASVKRTAPKIVEVADASPPLPQGSPFPKPFPAQARAEMPTRVASAGPIAAQPVSLNPAEASPAEANLARPAPVRPNRSSRIWSRPTRSDPASRRRLRPCPCCRPNRLRSAAPMATRRQLRNLTPDPTPTADLPPPPGARPGVLGVLSSKDMAQLPAQRTVTASVTPMAPAAAATSTAARETARPLTNATAADSKPRISGWIIQVGAFEDRDEATRKARRGSRQGRQPAQRGRSLYGNLQKGRAALLPRPLRRLKRRCRRAGL